METPHASATGRTYTVSMIADGHGKQYVPYLRLRGAWLRLLGFDPGARYAVQVEAGRLVLSVIAQEAFDPGKLETPA